MMRFFPSSAEARLNGYYVQFPHSSAEQLAPPSGGALNGTVWDIPTAIVGAGEVSVAQNANRFDAMTVAFPCMNVDIQYNRKVVKEPNRSERDGHVAGTEDNVVGIVEGADESRGDLRAYLRQVQSS